MNGALLSPGKHVAHDEETKDAHSIESSDFTSDEDDHDEQKQLEEEEETEPKFFIH
jgi:hypothetical protein